MKKMERPLNLDSAVDSRREDCVHYKSCLSEASTLLWASFSCEGCPLFRCATSEGPRYDRAASALGWEV